jgi:hypothetical protein
MSTAPGDFWNRTILFSAFGSPAFFPHYWTQQFPFKTLSLLFISRISLRGIVMRIHVRAAIRVLVMGSVCFAALPQLGNSQEKVITTDELAKQADVVAVGKVTSMKSEWNSDKTRIYTRVTIGVDEYLKGGSGGSIEVLVPGGEIGRVGELYTHMPKFKKDEDVVLFAEKDKKGRYRVAGGSEGKYNVKKDERTGERIVSNRTTLETFTKEIRKAVSE